MDEIMLWFEIGRWIVTYVGLLVLACSIITMLTPTPRNDTMSGALYSILELFALNVGRAKDRAPNQTGGRFVPK